MNFDLDETQGVVAETAATALKAAETASAAAGGVAAAWQALAKAGLLALTLPGWLGGDNLGVLEAAVLLTEVGRAAATVPTLATIMLGALPVTRWGSRELQERLLAGVAEGETILTAALREQSSGLPAQPSVVADLAAPAGQGTVSGVKVGVPYAGQARWILVPAALAGGGRAVVVVDPAAGGVTLTPTPASGLTPEYTVRLDAAPVAGVLGVTRDDRQDPAASGAPQADDRRGAAIDDLYRLALAGAAAVADGAVAGALALTAGYIARREQFGRPLATFQAVAGQVADVYITSRTLHLAALSAAWRIAAGLDATHDTDVAAYWLASEGPAALRTCHQLHGGIGVDISYPLHRYSAMVTDLARFVSGAEYCLERLAQEQVCSST